MEKEECKNVGNLPVSLSYVVLPLIHFKFYTSSFPFIASFFIKFTFVCNHSLICSSHPSTLKLLRKEFPFLKLENFLIISY